MKRKISTYVLCLMATVGCAGYAFSQPTKIIRLPSGIEVYDLSGEWDALIEIYGQAAAFGAYPNVVKITITGSFCPITGQITSPIRIIGVELKSDTPSQESGQAGRELFRGELESNEFQKLEMISDDGKVFPCKGQMSKNGNKIEIDAPNHGRMTLTRK
jgi:hypothetical protein